MGQIGKNAGQEILKLVKAKAPQIEQNIEKVAPQAAEKAQQLLETPAVKALLKKLQ